SPIDAPQSLRPCGWERGHRSNSSVIFGDPKSLFRAIAATVAAFANTAGGTLLVGVQDDHTLEGLRAESPQARDRFVQALWNTIRDMIRPTPVLDLHFEETQGATIARLCVPRGLDPLYGMSGVVYVRRGAATVPAQPEEIQRLLEQ